MATPKKYANNIDTNARHHYDVYELDGDMAIHIAPFTQEFEAHRVAEALAALDVLDEGAVHESVYVVRARATVAHNIHRRDAKTVKRAYKNMAEMRARFADLLEGESVIIEPTKTAVGEDSPKTTKRKKNKSAA